MNRSGCIASLRTRPRSCISPVHGEPDRHLRRGTDTQAGVRTPAGELVVSATRDDNHCFIGRVPLHGRRLRRSCSLELTKVLRTLADMGCMYPEAIALFQQANPAAC